MPSFGASQPSNFSFGGGSGSSTGASNPFSFLSQPQSQPTQNGGAFGGNATSSFPPAQSSASSNAFTSSSFPAFGGGTTNGGFNPQPQSTGFNFTAGTSNPFAASSSAPTTNGSGSGGFSGSIFNIPPSQPQQASSPFGGAPQKDTSSAAPSGGLFSTGAAPQNNAFGGFGTSGQSNNATTTSTAAPTNLFGTSTSASGGLFNFNPTSQPAAQESASTTKPGLFSSVTPAAPASKSEPPASTSFTGFGAKPQGDVAATAAPSSGFAFGTSTPDKAAGTPAPSGAFSLFGTTSQGGTSSTPAPTASLFKGFGTSTPAAEPSTTAPAFKGFGTSTQPEAQSTPAPMGNLFGLSSAPEKKDAIPAPAGNPTAASTNQGNLFGFGTTTKANATTTTPESTSLNASTPTKTNLFGFGTSQTTKQSENTTKEAQSGLPKFSLGAGFPNASQTPKPSGLFAQPSEPTPLAPNAFEFSKKSEPAKTTPFSLFNQQPQPESSKTESPQKAPFAFPPQKPSAMETSVGSQEGTTSNTGLFSVAPAPSKDTQQSSSPSLFDRPPSVPKDQPSASPASTMPNLTGAAAPPSEAPSATGFLKVPKVHVPQTWSAPKAESTDLEGLIVQLSRLNTKYRAKLVQLPTTADWTSLSQWHFKEASVITKKIATAKKQIAVAKGITGEESSLSTKRKADEEAHRETYSESPSKKPREADTPGTPAPKSFGMSSTTPKATPPPATQTSSLFGNILNKTSGSTSGGLFAPKASENKESEPSKAPAAQVGFKSPFNFSNAAAGSKDATPKPSSQFPGFGASTRNGAAKPPSFGGFFSSFASSAKTYEQLRAERKQKAMDEDYDSDEETEEQWSARWEKEEAEREAKAKERDAEKEKEKATTGSAASAPKAASDATSASNPFSFSGLSKPASGTSTPGFFSSRVGSPAPSHGGAKSVFDTPDAAPTPTADNIFGHLSPAPSSHNQDEDEEEEEEEQGYRSESQSQAATSEAGGPKATIVIQSESESEESLEEAMRRKKQDTSKKPSLLSRMTKEDATDVEANESEKEDDKSSKAVSAFGKSTNGAQTPSKSFFFDFAAAGAQSAPPKSDAFAGDQTFKPGTPIKFGSTFKEAPTFQIQPATPSPADFSATPLKPVSSVTPSTFSFLNAGQSGPASISSSVLSSRAPTPLSEAETSGKDSEAENESEEGKQVDFSALTEQEKAEHDVLFYTEQALAKHQVEKSGAKTWENYARGPLWILKNKESTKALVRIRTNSGAIPLNYYILPKLSTNVTGNSKKMVSAIGTKKDGKTGNIVFAFKTTELAEEFSKIYNKHLP